MPFQLVTMDSAFSYQLQTDRGKKIFPKILKFEKASLITDYFLSVKNFIIVLVYSKKI